MNEKLLIHSPANELEKFLNEPNDEKYVKEAEEYMNTEIDIEFQEPQNINTLFTSEEEDDEEYLIQDLLPIFGVTILAGQPKIGKSWFVLVFTLNIIYGDKAFNFFNILEKFTVWYIAMEDNEKRLKKRIKHLEKGQYKFSNKKIKNKGYLNTSGFPPMRRGGLAQILKFLDQQNDIKLIIIDTLERFIERNPSSGYSDEYKNIAILQKICFDKEINIILVHHTRKQPHKRIEEIDIVNEVSGTFGLTGATDNIWGLHIKQGNLCFSTTGRDLPQEDYAVENLGWNINIPGKYSKIIIDETERNIIELFTENKQELKLKLIAQAIEKTPQNTSPILNRMQKKQLIEKSKHGVYKLKI